MDINKIQEISSELLKLTIEVSQERDKDKKIELYEMILAKTTEFMAIQEKVMNEGADKIKDLNGMIHVLYELSVKNPKECRRKLKALYQLSKC